MCLKSCRKVEKKSMTGPIANQLQHLQIWFKKKGRIVPFAKFTQTGTKVLLYKVCSVVPGFVAETLPVLFFVQHT